jgi:ActR/RegA family two-component response regulator
MPSAHTSTQIDYDTRFAGVLARSLNRRGYCASIAPALNGVQRLLPLNTRGNALISLNLGSALGSLRVKALTLADAKTVIVVFTGLASVETVSPAINLRASCCRPKPSSGDPIEAGFGRPRESQRRLRLPGAPFFSGRRNPDRGSIENVSQ